MTSYDFIIIGGGVTGMGAAVYSARFNMKTLVLAGRMGGLIQDTHIVENYPGFKSVTGGELANSLIEHAKIYSDVVDIKEEFAIDVSKNKEDFIVKTENGKYTGKTILFATGTKRKKLNVKGEEEFLNKGVSYCATCDGPLYKGLKVIIIGGSDSAAKEALMLSDHAKEVYIIYRKEKIRAEPINLKRVEAKKNIKIINNTNVVEVKGDKFVTSVIFDKAYQGKTEFKCDGVFVEIGHEVLSELAVKLGVEVDEKGEIITNKDSETNVPGIFAGGDVVSRPWKQAIVGVSEGVLASWRAYEYISIQKVKK